MSNYHYKTIFFSVLAAIFAAAVCWHLYDITRPTIAEAPSPIAIAPDEKPAVRTYTNAAFGFSLEYPQAYSLADAASNAAQSELVRVTVPASAQPNTNFREAWVSVAADTRSAAQKDCLAVPQGANALPDRSIGGVTFAASRGTDAGAGNYYDQTRYAAVHAGACVVIAAVIHSTNIGNYSPDQGIAAFDKPAIDATLESVVKSIAFAQ